jgi:hypothetical protein
VPHTPVWHSGAESGSTLEFTGGVSDGGGGAPTCDSGTKRSGNYSLKTPHDGLAKVRITGIAATVFSRIYFKAAAHPTNGVVIAGWGTSSILPRVNIFLNADGTVGWANGSLPSSPTVSGSSVISTSDWNRLDIKFVRDAAVGGVEVYLNGVLQFTDLNQSTTSGTSASAMYWYFGNDLSQPGTNQSGIDIFFDDMAVGTVAYIEEGHVYGFQGKAGTPTYNAWTKNGDTTAALCWSETPPSATKNCTSVINAQNQTMLVDDAAIDAVLPVGSTIHAVMVVGIGKAGAGTPGAHTIYRVGGVDTLGANSTFSTPDQWFPNGVNGDPLQAFVDTLANLEASEIGAQSSTSGNTVQVEDMWLMVDATPSVRITPGTGSLSITGQQADQTNTMSPNIRPGSGSLTLVGQPAHQRPFDVPAGALALTGYAPGVRITLGLRVAFDIITPVRSPLTVMFDVQDPPEGFADPLTVSFDIAEANGTPLTVTFDINSTASRRLSDDIQGPVAKVVLT